MNIKHCKMCGEAEFGPLHILERELHSVCTQRIDAERRLQVDLAQYFSEREKAFRNELFQRAKFVDIGYHEFEAEDNLDMVERLAKERGLV